MHPGGESSLEKGQELMSSAMDMWSGEDLWIILVEKFRVQLSLKPAVKWRELGWRCNRQLEIVGGNYALREHVWTICVLAMHSKHLWAFQTTHIKAPPQT